MAVAMSSKLQGLGELASWSDRAAEFHPGALLLGNGASRAVWDPFGYPSLFEQAKSVASPLSAEALALFKYLGDTKNFEQVLRLLSAAQQVVSGLKMSDDGAIQNCYENVRDALIASVHAVHVPWPKITPGNFEEMKAEIQKYSRIFTTNYDLLTYWTIMSGLGPGAFKDFFIDGGAFDSSLPPGERIPIYYLHGALHLYKAADNSTWKHTRTDFDNLLDLFASSFMSGRTPLFVSEGTSGDKLRSIYDSDYLSFTFEKLEAYRAPGRLTVFGHSLSEAFDSHIIEALRPKTPRIVAISIFPDSPEKIAAVQLDLKNRLDAWDLWFFDSTTHPLGAVARRV